MTSRLKVMAERLMLIGLLSISPLCILIIVCGLLGIKNWIVLLGFVLYTLIIGAFIISSLVVYKKGLKLFDVIRHIIIFIITDIIPIILYTISLAITGNL